ncbi:acid-sensing ion channel 1A-like isoform X2 [Glandiceps talaboti]
MSSYDNTKVFPLTDFAGLENGISSDAQDRNDASKNDRDGENKETSWHEVMLAFTQTAGLTGVRFIGDGKSLKFRRLLWLLIVLGALGGLLYQISRLINSFLDMPINVNIKYTHPTEKPDFPAITICNNNLFRYSGLLTLFDGSASAVQSMIPYLNIIFPLDGNTFYSESDFITAEEYNNYGNTDLLGFMTTSAHSIDNLVKSCSFSGIPCGPENFTTSVTNYGICYTFNSAQMDETLKVRNAGQRYGLQLQLYANQNEYVGPRTVVGFRVMVHDQDEIPDVAGQGVSISPGVETTIGLTKTMISNLGSPYGDCVDNVENTLKYFNGSYSLSKCWTECETDYAIDKCGCRYYYMPGNMTYCTPNDLRYCYFDAIDDLAQETDACSSCREPCDQIKYNMKLSYGVYPSQQYGSTLYYANRWPCPDAIGFYLQKRSPFYAGTTQLDSLAWNDMTSALDSITYNGQNISEFMPSELKPFNQGIMETLYGLIYRDTALSILGIFWNYMNRDYDDVGSDFYYYLYMTSHDAKMNIHETPWDVINATVRIFVSYGNVSSDDIDDIVDTLVTGYYVPLFDEAFPMIFTSLRDARDELADDVTQYESFDNVCIDFMR